MFPVSTVSENMTMGAYNLPLVIPVILDDYLLPNGLVEQNADRIRITPYGRKIFENISKPGVSLDEIMDIIEAGSKDAEPDDITRLIRQLLDRLNEMHRPRIFFNIVPSQKVNMLNAVLRNSGRSPEFDIHVFLTRIYH